MSERLACAKHWGTAICVVHSTRHFFWVLCVVMLCSDGRKEGVGRGGRAFVV